MKKLSILIFPVFILVFALTTASVTNAKSTSVTVKQHPQALPVVGTYEKLQALLAEAEKTKARDHRQYMAEDNRTSAIMKSAQGTLIKADIVISGSTAPQYSGTNLQVSGVDEGDIIKTDGKFIYQVNNRKVVIVRAYPAEEMEVVTKVEFEDPGFTPQELYVDNKHMVVVGSTYYNTPAPEKKASSAPREKNVSPEIYPPIFVHNTVKIIIFDLNDRTNLKKIRELEVDGSYISSRKIGSSFYLVANKYINYYSIMEKVSPATPAYRDSAGSGDFEAISCEDIRYFPGSPEPNYLLIAAINLEKPAQEMEVSTYLGAGQNIYASLENLYVAVAQYDLNTIIYKFALAGGRTSCSGKGKVPGTILNQFSMDEYNGFFRIATTKGEPWGAGENISANNIYVLDNDLTLTGKIENIAPGERIYSVRFTGGRGYMVTFKKVDPLFVIDLNDPRKPRILGELKIPGYSDYLHPYDENHIIGFGKDTEEVAGQNFAYYQGMKMAVFDVSDVRHPVEKFREIIGDRGTESELLHNHKALLFSKAKELLAFPVQVMEVTTKSSVWGSPQYGQFAFQGAYVYNFNLKDGFQLKGKITHLDPGSTREKNDWSTDGSKYVNRLLYIGDTLYTMSQGAVKAHDLHNLQEIKNIAL